jgi:hypothetical protein
LALPAQLSAPHSKADSTPGGSKPTMQLATVRGRIPLLRSVRRVVAIRVIYESKEPQDKTCGSFDNAVLLKTHGESLKNFHSC